MTPVELAELERLVKLCPGLDTYYASDGSGGGEPDYIWLGHDGDGDRCIELDYVQGDETRAILDHVFALANAVPRLLDELKRR